MTKFHCDPQMKTSYRVCEEDEILKESISSVVQTELNFAQKWISNYIEKREFILTDCKNAILDFLKIKKDSIEESVARIKYRLSMQEENKIWITVLKNDIEDIIKYVENQ